MEFLEDVQLQAAQLTVGDDKEVAATTGRIEEAQSGEALLQITQFVSLPDLQTSEVLELRPHAIEEQRADKFENVGLAGVVRADLAALFLVHDALEQGTEDGGTNTFPAEVRRLEQRVAHGGGEIGKLQLLGKEITIHIRELALVFLQSSLAFILRRVEDAKEAV